MRFGWRKGGVRTNGQREKEAEQNYLVGTIACSSRDLHEDRRCRTPAYITNIYTPTPTRHGCPRLPMTRTAEITEAENVLCNNSVCWWNVFVFTDAQTSRVFLSLTLCLWCFWSEVECGGSGQVSLGFVGEHEENLSYFTPKSNEKYNFFGGTSKISAWFNINFVTIKYVLHKFIRACFNFTPFILITVNKWIWIYSYKYE